VTGTVAAVAARPGRVLWKHLGDVPPGAGADSTMLPDAGSAWPSPGRYAVTAGALDRAWTGPSPTVTVSGARLPGVPAAAATRLSVSFTGPLDPRRPGGHRCP
jgi:hypothetical protein